MNAITVEATLELALSCARSFGVAVTRAACDAIAERAALEELARSPLSVPGGRRSGTVAGGAGAGSAAADVDAAQEVDAPRTRAAAAGVDAQAVFAFLFAADPVRLSAAERVQYVKAAVAQVAWAESRVNAAMLAVAGVTRRIHAVQVGIEGTRAERIEIEDAARSEIALAARWSEAQAQQRLESARLLHHLLPETATALADGSLSLAHATVIAEGAARLAVGAGVDVTHPGTDRDCDVWLALTDAAAQLDRRASLIAARSTRSHTRAAVTRIVDGLDPAGMRARREAAKAAHDVWVQAEGDGNALLIARLGAVDAHACLARIREQAQALREIATAAGEPDTRTLGQLRVQVLTDAILGGRRGEGNNQRTDAAHLVGSSQRTGQAAAVVALPGAATPTARSSGGRWPIRADIQVVITLDALLGLQAVDGAADRAIVRGHSGDDELLPAAEIRDLIADGDAEVTLRRLVTDPLTGRLLDASPRRYKPSQKLRDFIQTRDVRCRWPGCNLRASSTRTDIDHAQPFEAGGSSTRANLGVLCRRHHLLKTHAGYEITDSDDSGACTLTTPAGEHYRHQPTPVLPNDDPPPF